MRQVIGEADVPRDVISDGGGIGSGARVTLCYDKAAARNSREHNDSNVLTLGGRLLTASLAEAFRSRADAIPPDYRRSPKSKRP
ncbi:MAG: RpiB/LacA/LacB family sugar-phosphate isomerase [Bryobacteraceae bacterium]|jgi:ribose 5-phosphate isomerase RpiB